MFTGLVQATGTWEGISGSRLRIRGVLPGGVPEIGESVAVNGVCLTLVAAGGGTLEFDVLGETLGRTAFRAKRAGCAVNLERALRAGDALGGHFVSGHVDCTGTLAAVEDAGGDRALRVRPEDERLFAWLLPKGSVAIDGVSLTLVDVRAAEGTFTVHVIPHTWECTALRGLKAGAAVNLEADLLAKAVRQAAETPADSSTAAGSVTWEKLREAGFC